jgi:hypothetical protein
LLPEALEGSVNESKDEQSKWWLRYELSLTSATVRESVAEAHEERIEATVFASFKRVICNSCCFSKL